MSSSIADAFQKALSKTQAQATIPAEWDDEPTNTTPSTITEITTMQTQTTDTKRVYFQPTNNVVRSTFNCVRDNPGSTRSEIANILESQGYKRNSVQSLLGQMIKQNQVRQTNELLYVNQPEYTPLKSGAMMARKKLREESKPKRTYVKRNAAAKAAAYEEHENYNPHAVEAIPKTKRVASTNTLLADTFDAQKFVDGMTLGQAKAVYDALSKIFRG